MFLCLSISIWNVIFLFSLLIVSSIALPLIRLVVFHILFVLLLASLYLASKTNPGTIPLYWGFYIGDQEYKKKRYCLLCQVFKPDRTHHCRHCRKCIRKLDHHCHILATCIGELNYKFFIQTLFYCTCTLLYILFTFASFNTLKRSTVFI